MDRWIERIVVLVLFYPLGPAVLCAKRIQERAAGPMWQAEERWSPISGLAFSSLLWYVPVAIFYTQLTSLWSSAFITLASLAHLPFLAWLGDTSFWLALPSSTLLRWLLALPLTWLLAVLIEMVQPKTTWHIQRVITPEEQAQVAAQNMTNKTKTDQQSQATPTAKSPAKTKKRSSAKTEKPLLPILPKSDSLWASADWQNVADNHPLKQAAQREEARLQAQQRAEDRKRWFAQQQTSQTIQPVTPVPSSQTIDSTSQSPEQPADRPQQNVNREQNQYNWDEGDGSIEA